jgi:hypothetical protein
LTDVPFVVRSNGCTRTFNVLGVAGTGVAEKQYDAQAEVMYAAISNNVAATMVYQSLVEGYDNCLIRTNGTLGYPACGTDNVMTTWFATVLGWAGFAEASVCSPATTIGVDDLASAPPAVRTSLTQAYPNPMNPTATIRYTVGTPGKVSLKVFDVSGRVVRTLVDETQATGAYAKIWDGTTDRGEKVASGVFFYQLNAPGYSGAKKIVVLQ